MPKGRPKGQPKLGGRKKGALNKGTECMRKAWTLAFDKLGGANGLAKWAKDHPTDFYKLASKLIPTQIIGDKDNPLIFQIKNAADSARKKLDAIINTESTGGTEE